MLRSGSSERQQMTARLENPKALSPNLDRRNIVIPPLTHERQAVWRISDNRIDAAIRQSSENFQAVAAKNVNSLHG
jgi:hypothetical protein